MKKLTYTLLSLVAVTAAMSTGCSTPPAGNDAAVDVPTATVDNPTVGVDNPNPTVDNPNPTVDNPNPTDVPNMMGTPCARYCAAVTASCAGANAQFVDAADCNTWCAAANIPTGTAGAVDGNSLECRIYHAGVAMGMPAAHCPHAGPSGGDVCGMVNFNNAMPVAFTRVDRMGMPAVSTVLIGAAAKNRYNDGNPSGDSTFVPDFAGSLISLHMALDDDFARLNFTTCSMVTQVNMLPECLGQEFAAGRTVASLIVPNDVLRLELNAPAGFPNGRKLADPVIDVTLAVLFLRINRTGPGMCGAVPCSPGTLAGVPVNPARNDVNMGMFPDTFPYLLPAQAP